MTDSEPMQLGFFGEETPTSEIPRLNCTCSEDCPAEADEHMDACPIEQRLLDELAF